jgi:hypothetical protein
MPGKKLKKGEMMLKVSSQQRAILREYLTRKVAELTPQARKNKVLRRDVQYLKTLLLKVEKKCPTCGQVLPKRGGR